METLNTLRPTPPQYEVRISISPEGSIITLTLGGTPYSWDNTTNSAYARRYHAHNTALTFTATTYGAGTIYPGASPALYTWDMGDGVTLTGSTVTHTYLTAVPSVRVRVVMTDTSGHTATAMRTLNLT